MNTENNENQEEKKTDEQTQKVKIYVIDTGKIKQTKAFARQDGAILGIVCVSKKNTEYCRATLEIIKLSEIIDEETILIF